MVAGRRLWNLIWYGILLLGVLGLVASIHWGRRTQWKNIDETIRAIGTVLVSVGMLLLLNGVGGVVGQLLLLAALISFVCAFILGRQNRQVREPTGDEGDDSEPAPPPPGTSE